MFVDEAEITVIGGQGGAGNVSFFVAKGGPCGGNGGRGGNVYATINPSRSNLKKYTSIIKYEAESGGHGDANNRHGKNGKDLYLQLPIGTTITDIDTNLEIELNRTNPEILLCRGGEGGLGNNAMKSPTNRTPKRAENGKPGETKRFKLIVKLIADFGLIGLPNAGKSSLLNELTAANVKTAEYPFTTLEPNLGVLDGRVIADIPGLIEGASTGRGLGIKFLKHIEKVKLLIHCISVESLNISHDFLTVTNELKHYNENLLKKKMILLLTKIDLVDKKTLGMKLIELKKLGKVVYPISIHDWDSLQNLKKVLNEASSN